MTCTHVLGLIDAGPFADYPRAHLEAAWRHARGCATCGPALRAATALTSDLPALPRPAPPPDLAAGILARIEQIEPARIAPAVVTESETGASGLIDWPAWATAAGAIAAGLAIIRSIPADEAAIDVASLDLGRLASGLVRMPATVTGAIALAAGLLLYVGGLFARLDGGKRADG